MKRYYLAVLLSSLLVASCGDGNNENSSTNNGATNTATNNENSETNNENAETNNAETNNAETNNNTTANNVTTNNQRDEPYITEFRYYEEEESALGSTTEGFTIGVNNKTISNEDGNSKPLTDADLAAFETAHLGTDTIDAMRNGWGCPEPMTGGGDMGSGADAGTDAGTSTGPNSTWWFEARIQEGGNVREIQEITGCVQTDEAATGEIITALEELGAEYL